MWEYPAITNPLLPATPPAPSRLIFYLYQLKKQGAFCDSALIPRLYSPSIVARKITMAFEFNWRNGFGVWLKILELKMDSSGLSPFVYS